MFDRCSNLETLDLSSFNTKAGSNKGSMFYSCTKLERVVLSCDASNLSEVIKSGLGNSFKNDIIVYV